MEVGVLFIGLLAAVAVYFIPALIGGSKENSGKIFVLNLVLGWTVIIWLICLIWAIMDKPRPKKN